MDEELETQDRTPIGLTGSDAMRDQFIRNYNASPQDVDRPQEAPVPNLNSEDEEGGPEGSPGVMQQFLLSTGRGIARSVNATSDALVGASRWVADKAGMDLDQDFRNPFNIPVQEEYSQGLWGFYEGLVQFSTVFVPASGAVRALGWTGKGLKGMAALKSAAARGAVAGAVADLLAFDPQEARLSNLLENAPIPVVNSVAAYLAADEDDGELEGRMKNVLEGFIVGSTLDAAMLGIRVSKINRLHASGKLTTEEATEAAEAHLARAAEVESEASFRVEETEQGFEVVPAQRVTFDDLSHRTSPEAAAEIQAGGFDASKGSVYDGGDVPGPDGSIFFGFPDGIDWSDMQRLKADLTGEVRAGAQLDRPLHIRSDADIDKLMEALGGELDRAAWNGLSETYDGIVVHPESIGDGTSRAAQMFGEDQIVVFKPENISIKAETVSGPERPPPKAPEGQTFKTRAEAEDMAHAMNEVEKSYLSAPVDAQGNRLLDESQVSRIRAATARILTGENLDDVDNFLQGIDFNFGRIDAPDESYALINAVSEVVADEMGALTNRFTEGRGQSNSETVALALSHITDEGADAIVNNIVKLYGNTVNLPQILTASRIIFQDRAARISKIASRLDVNPNNPVTTQLLADELDSFANFAIHLAGTKSNIARTLQSLNIKVSPQQVDAIRTALGADEADQLLQATAKSADGAAEGAAKVPPVRQQATEAAEELSALEKLLRGEEISDELLPEALKEAQGQAGKGTRAVNADDFIRMWNNRAAKSILQKAKEVAEGIPDADPQALIMGEVKNAQDILKAGAEEVPEVTEEALKLAGEHPGMGRNAIENIARIIARERGELDKLASTTVAERAAAEAEKVAARGSEKEILTANPLDILIQDAQRPLTGMDYLNRVLRSEKRQLDEIASGRAAERAQEAAEAAAGRAAEKEFLTGNPVSSFIARNKMTPREIRLMARSLRHAAGDEASIMRALRYTVKIADNTIGPPDPSLMQRFIGFRAAMLLSGLKTQVVNATTSGLATQLLPAELIVGGIIKRDGAISRMGLDMLTAPWVEGRSILREAVSAARKTLKDGENYLDPNFGQDDANLHRVWTQDPNANFLTKVLGMPGRLLMTGDEFNKQLAYRSHLRAQTMRSVREEIAGGVEHTPESISQRVHDELEAAFDPDGASLNPYATEHARTATFTNRIDYGVGKALLDLGNQHPSFRIIMPFIRTPVNIFRFGFQRFPGIGLLQRQMQEDLASGDSGRIAAAYGKQAVGAVTYTMAAMMAFDRTITGAGPTNPQLRSQMLDAGWKPYAVRTPGGGYVQFNRAEPLATPMMVTADFVESMGELDGENAEEAMVALMAAFAHSASSKTFLVGLSDFFAAVSEGEPYKTQQFLSNFITSSTVPALVRQVNPDPIWREANGIIQDMRSQTPLSANMEPRRNLFGEPVVKTPGYFQRSFNPFTVTSASTIDDTLMELAEIGRAMPSPRTTMRDGRIDLQDPQWSSPEGQTAYDRMMELLSTPLLRNQTLRERITQEMSSEAWQSMGSGTDLFKGGEKYVRVEALVRRYVGAAQQRMLQEKPELRAAIRTDRETERDVLLGRLQDLSN